jgi:hypothetical protein
MTKIRDSVVRCITVAQSSAKVSLERRSKHSHNKLPRSEAPKHEMPLQPAVRKPLRPVSRGCKPQGDVSGVDVFLRSLLQGNKATPT